MPDIQLNLSDRIDTLTDSRPRVPVRLRVVSFAFRSREVTRSVWIQTHTLLLAQALAVLRDHWTVRGIESPV